MNLLFFILGLITASGTVGSSYFISEYYDFFTNEGLTDTKVSSTADVILDNEQSPPKITTIQITVDATAPSLSESRFQELLDQTEKECPIKNLLQGAEISIKTANLATA